MLKTAATVSRRSTTENGCVRKIMKLPSERVMVWSKADSSRGPRMKPMIIGPAGNWNRRIP